MSGIFLIRGSRGVWGVKGERVLNGFKFMRCSGKRGFWGRYFLRLVKVRVDFWLW